MPTQKKNAGYVNMPSGYIRTQEISKLDIVGLRKESCPPQIKKQVKGIMKKKKNVDVKD
jgi:hypothetical protein